jgi:hypothetical protein
MRSLDRVLNPQALIHAASRGAGVPESDTISLIDQADRFNFAAERREDIAKARRTIAVGLTRISP